MLPCIMLADMNRDQCSYCL